MGVCVFVVVIAIVVGDGGGFAVVVVVVIATFHTSLAELAVPLGRLFFV